MFTGFNFSQYQARETDTHSNKMSVETVYPRSSDSESEIVMSKKPRMKRTVSSESDDDTITVSDRTEPSCKSNTPDNPAKKRKILKTEDDSTPLPDPFPLPKYYPQDVEVALKRKKLSSREKQRFISEVASAMLRYKRYPSCEDYICVARSIVQKYPFFKLSGGKPYVSDRMFALHVNSTHANHDFNHTVTARALAHQFSFLLFILHPFHFGIFLTLLVEVLNKECNVCNFVNSFLHYSVLTFFYTGCLGEEPCE